MHHAESGCGGHLDGHKLEHFGIVSYRSVWPRWRSG